MIIKTRQFKFRRLYPVDHRRNASWFLKLHTQLYPNWNVDHFLFKRRLRFNPHRHLVPIGGVQGVVIYCHQLKCEDAAASTCALKKAKHVSGLTTQTDDLEFAKPQSGHVTGLEMGWTTEMNCAKTKNVCFAKPFPSTPTVLHSFRKIEIPNKHGPVIANEVPNISNESFDLKLQSWNSTVSNLEANWMALPNNDVNFQHGELDTADLTDRPKTQNAAFRIYFSKPYKVEPKVTCWFTKIDQPFGWRSLAGRQFNGAKVMWLAWDSESNGKKVQFGAKTLIPENALFDVKFSGSFAQKPEVFTALSYVDMPGQLVNYRVALEAQSVTQDGAKLRRGVWSDSTRDEVGLVRIAFN
ncbi:hypothetical protein EDB80DRAFT_681055 [Ilyonectria destructans]|nr:hypothetical protein EDB80DRAFT_681055 [Ilyonectria destructans]